mgnify:CR=1 FL=1|tara:strand:- start:5 stop:331 length:327 start_codon:yes stop_codon:yes gene_type:complete
MLKTKSEKCKRLLELKSNLKLSWLQIASLTGVGVNLNWIDLNRYGYKKISNMITALECLGYIQECLSEGFRCAFVLNKEQAKIAKNAIESKRVKAYVDLIDNKYMVSW